MCNGDCIYRSLESARGVNHPSILHQHRASNKHSAAIQTTSSQLFVLGHKAEPAISSLFFLYCPHRPVASTMELQPHQPDAPRASSEDLLHRNHAYDHHDHAQEHQHHPQEPQMASALLTNTMDANDLECPHNWPLHRKAFTSFACWCMAASVYVHHPHSPLSLPAV